MFAAIDADTELDLDDLDQFASAAYLTGHDEEAFGLWARGHQACVEQGVNALQFCHERFRDFQFGAKLIQKNTGQDTFSLPRTAIEDPDCWLSNLVVASYGNREKDDRSMKSESPDPDRTPPGPALAPESADRPPEPNDQEDPDDDRGGGGFV